jgi:hypothetical protein
VSAPVPELKAKSWRDADNLAWLPQFSRPEKNRGIN